MIDADLVLRAKAVPIEHELARRGVRMRGRVDQAGPCPVCGGRDRFGVSVRKQVWHCRGCARGGDVIALVQHIDGISFTEAVELLAGVSVERPQAQIRPAAAKESERKYEQDQRRKAAGMWQHRKPIAGTPAERYLRNRGITCLPPTLAYLPPTKAGHFPAMIVAFILMDEREPGVLGIPRGVINAIHLTLIKPDGSGKADVEKQKLIIGRPKSRPIVLAPPNDLLGLAITEGIEDALSIYQSTGLGVWAAGSASFLPPLADAVPDWMSCVSIIVDRDDAGRRFSFQLADRLRARGLTVELREL